MSRSVNGGARQSCEVSANVSFETEDAATNEVRQALGQGPAGALSQPLSSPLAHPSDRLVAQLNDQWRVVDDHLQWILQQRKGNARSKNCGWRGRSFCRTREALLRCVREYCCLPDQGQTRCICEYRGVDEAALAQLRALPEWHVDRS
jgi:hypothetical protein